MMSPKGAGFLYARPEVQHLVRPLVVGWGWSQHPEFSTGSVFLDSMQWLGTNDVSAYLSVPAAIQFQKEHNWPAIRKACHQMLAGGLHRIRDLTGLPSICPEEQADDLQMGAAELPPVTDLARLKRHLYEAYQVEVPLLEWNGRNLIRISVQGYNTQQDIDVLLAALEHLLP